MTTSRTRAERRDAVLDAAANRLQNAKVEFLKGLTFDQLSADTGIDRAQIAGDFTDKGSLIQALIRYCLTPGSLEEPWPENLAEDARGLLLDPTVGTETAMRQIGDLDDAYHATDRQFVAQMAIWALAGANNDARTQLRDLYQFFDRAHIQAWDSYLAHLADAGMTPKEGISTEEFIAILSAVAEGMAIRTAIIPEDAARSLTALAMVVLTEGALQLPGERASLGDLLAKVDQKRFA